MFDRERRVGQLLSLTWTYMDLQWCLKVCEPFRMKQKNYIYVFMMENNQILIFCKKYVPSITGVTGGF